MVAMDSFGSGAPERIMIMNLTAPLAPGSRDGLRLVLGTQKNPGLPAPRLGSTCLLTS